MADDNARLHELLMKRQHGNLPEAENKELFLLLQHENIESVLSSDMYTNWVSLQSSVLTGGLSEEKINLFMAGLPVEETDHPKMVRRIPALMSNLYKYAAAIIIVSGLSIYLWNSKNKAGKATDIHQHIAAKEIPPGGNKALLILNDESVVDLDTLSNGAAILQGNTRIIKSANGEIMYEPGGSSSTEAAVFMNTMKTPRGGQYQLTLPDGTQVWLNAESSINYPAVFQNNRREVMVTGEAYFEVTKNKEKPFIVKTSSDEIKVLGTSFNVNAYTNEQQIKTSLVQGAISINEKILKPGQAYTNGKIIATNTDRDIAWKNGLFKFEKADIETIMRQLARWYDIDVVYQGERINESFNATVPNNVSISKVLQLLELTGLVHFNIEGNKITVSR